MTLVESTHGTPAEFQGEYYDSQTEAAWAAFFTAAGMPFEHEPETFGIEDRGNLYTPDFFLPEQDTIIEVKNGPILWEACNKLATVSRGLGKTAVLLIGKPHNMSAYFFAPGSKRIASALDPKPHLAYADLVLNKPQTMPYSVSDIAKPYAERFRMCAEQAKYGWTTNVSESMRELHQQKKRTLRENIRVLQKEPTVPR